MLSRLYIANSIIANGSEDLICEPNGTKVVLVLTEAGHYKNLRLTDQGKALPAEYRAFVSCEALSRTLILCS